VHRHDIDSDVRTARKMFALEVRHGVSASYYFRLSTLDFGFMRDIEAAGGEASYHYEEVATFAKRHRLRRADDVRARFPEIRELFLRNFMRVREQLGLPMTTVASHGDFANRRLNVINHELLDDPAAAPRCGIECESYDVDLLRHFDLYISDQPYPVLRAAVAVRCAGAARAHLFPDPSRAMGNQLAREHPLQHGAPGRGSRVAYMNILLINHYAGSVRHGMEYRPITWRANGCGAATASPSSPRPNRTCAGRRRRWMAGCSCRKPSTASTIAGWPRRPTAATGGAGAQYGSPSCCACSAMRRGWRPNCGRTR
jgi:hypothetical protein